MQHSSTQVSQVAETWTNNCTSGLNPVREAHIVGENMSKIKTNPMERNQDKSLLKNVLRKVLYSTGFVCGKVANIKHIRDIKDWESISSVAKVHGYKIEEIYKGLIGFTFAVEQSIDGIAIGDLESKLTYVNDAFARMHGYSPEEMIGMKVVNLHNKEQMDEYNRGMKQIKTQGSWIGEIGHIRKDGTPFPTYVSVTLLKDPEGETGGIVLVCRDITDRKRAEEKLRESGQRYRRLFENESDAVMTFDAETLQFEDANQATLDLYGYTKEEFLTLKVVDISAEKEKTKAVIEKLNNGELESERVPLRYMRKKDGTIFPTEISTGTFISKGCRKLIGAVRDITERRRAEEALRESQEHARIFALYQHAISELREFYVTEVNLEQMLQKTVNVFVKDFGYYMVWYGQLKEDENVLIPKVWAGKYEKYLDGLRLELDDSKDAKCAMSLAVMKKKPFGYADLEHDKDFEKWRPLALKYGYRSNQAIPLIIGGKSIGAFLVYSIRPRAFSENLIRYLMGIVNELATIVEKITERKKAEAAYRALVDHSLQGLLILQDGRAVFANQAMTEITGYTVDEILAMSSQQVQAFVHPEDRALVWGRHRGRLKGKPLPARYEFRGIRKDGTTSWLEIHASRIEYQGKPAIQAAYVDITDRKRAEEALKESEQRYRTIFESMTDSLFILDVKGERFVEVNPAACKMYGYTHDEFLELTPSTLVHPDCAHLFGEFLETTEADGVFHTTSVDLRKDGTPIDVQVDGRMISYQGKAHLLAVVRDITDRKKAEERLLDDQAKLKSLASQLTLAEERERRRIATELHDRISQSLVISKMNLEALRKSEYGKKTDETLDEICNSLAQTIADTRTLTFDLSSPILYELGFETAVAEWLTEQIRDKHGIATQFEDDGRPKPLDDDIRVLLFRDVRELLINVVRHAWADQVKVSIRKFDEQICVSVEDDGVGFDPAETASMATKRAEFGLFSIRQRLEELGGHLEIESEPGRGCKVMMTAPLKQK